MSIQQLDNGGRVAFEKTPFADYRVEWDKDGLLISESITIKTPEQSPKDMMKQARKVICTACDIDCPVKHKKNCDRNRWLSKPDAVCPDGKWP